MGLFTNKKNTSQKEGDFSTDENVLSKKDIPESITYPPQIASYFVTPLDKPHQFQKNL